MFTLERRDSGEIAIVVHINFSNNSIEELDEFIELVKSAAVSPVAVVQGSRVRADAKYFVGSGKVDEIKQAILEEEADVVLFNHALSPAQERNLEQKLECRVLDRTGVILDIFAQRARSHEGQLQVELAQLTHMSTRLVRGWTHLERQKGGIGLRGPGETQLETDRRLLNDRIKQLKKRLQKVHNQRQQSRRSRVRAHISSVSLVGYTNAGKSSLFNKLSDAEVYAENQLFATLDPTLKRVELPNKTAVVLADTVGFIRQLPHDLVNAFHATLQEVKEADLLLQIVDSSHSEKLDHIIEVEKVIKLVGAEKVPQIIVYNKIDLLERGSEHNTKFQPRIDRNEQGQIEAVWISALKGEGLDLLQQAISEFFTTKLVIETVLLTPAMGRTRAMLYKMTEIISENIDDEGNFDIKFSCSNEQYNALNKLVDVEQYTPNYKEKKLQKELLQAQW